MTRPARQAFDTFPHCDVHTIFAYLKELRRVLRRGARALVHTANILAPRGFARFAQQKSASVRGPPEPAGSREARAGGAQGRITSHGGACCAATRVLSAPSPEQVQGFCFTSPDVIRFLVAQAG